METIQVWTKYGFIDLDTRTHAKWNQILDAWHQDGADPDLLDCAVDAWADWCTGNEPDPDTRIDNTHPDLVAQLRETIQAHAHELAQAGN